MLIDRGVKGRSLIAEAAFHGDKTTFEAAIMELRTRLGEEKVRSRIVVFLYPMED